MQSRLYTKGLFQFQFEIAYMEFTMLFEDTNLAVCSSNNIIVVHFKSPYVNLQLILDMETRDPSKLQIQKKISMYHEGWEGGGDVTQ